MARRTGILMRVSSSWSCCCSRDEVPENRSQHVERQSSKSQQHCEEPQGEYWWHWSCLLPSHLHPGWLSDQHNTLSLSLFLPGDFFVPFQVCATKLVLRFSSRSPPLPPLHPLASIPVLSQRHHGTTPLQSSAFKLLHILQTRLLQRNLLSLFSMPSTTVSNTNLCSPNAQCPFDNLEFGICLAHSQCLW